LRLTCVLKANLLKKNGGKKICNFSNCTFLFYSSNLFIFSFSKNSFQNSQLEIENCLRDDFDFPAVMGKISELISSTHSWLLSNQGAAPPELLTAVTTWMHEFFQCLGIEFTSNEGISKGSSESEFGVAVANLLTQFRSQVKKLALSTKPPHNELLQACDELRKEASNHPILIKFEDLKDGTSLWKKK
jgi:cysteinyl-tRNA synthetase